MPTKQWSPFWEAPLKSQTQCTSEGHRDEFSDIQQNLRLNARIKRGLSWLAMVMPYTSQLKHLLCFPLRNVL